MPFITFYTLLLLYVQIYYIVFRILLRVVVRFDPSVFKLQSSLSNHPKQQHIVSESQ